MHERSDITKLSHELTYHRYLLNQGQVQSLFKEISIPEYIALHIISQSITKKDNNFERTYLKDIADELRLSIPQTSQMIGKLRDKGLVKWSHDGNGSEGTYISITDSGIRRLNQQETFLKDYYGRVIDKFGEENMLTLLQMMKKLETVMDEELKGDDANDI